jgi:transcriptional regulator of arginine metabolism
MKYNRHDEIISLIEEYEIETEEDLSERLRQKGSRVTQATISRDISELKLAKVTTSGGRQKYALPKKEENNMSTRYRNLLVEAIESLDCANNIVVVKTCAGMASGAAAAIDSMGRADLLGSVVGDDTVIIVMRTNDSAYSLIDALNEIIGNGK